MGIPCTQYLEGSKVWSCSRCRTHLTTDALLMSEDFVGKKGRAKLFEDVSNISRGEKQCSEMKTGTFIIREIECKACHQYVGWTYVQAYRRTEAYKEGKFILEAATIASSSNRSML